jgi:hypothetical protein
MGTCLSWQISKSPKVENAMGANSLSIAMGDFIKHL